MKIRTDFVTNSSSSSFIIAKKYLDKDQIEAIHNHIDLAIKLGMIQSDDSLMFAWDIDENQNYISGDVFMDNFSMYDFLERIGVPMDKVHWDESEDDLRDDDDVELDETWRQLLKGDSN